MFKRMSLFSILILISLIFFLGDVFAEIHAEGEINYSINGQSVPFDSNNSDGRIGQIADYDSSGSTTAVAYAGETTTLNDSYVYGNFDSATGHSEFEFEAFGTDKDFSYIDVNFGSITQYTGVISDFSFNYSFLGETESSDNNIHFGIQSQLSYWDSTTNQTIMPYTDYYGEPYGSNYVWENNNDGSLTLELSGTKHLDLSSYGSQDWFIHTDFLAGGLDRTGAIIPPIIEPVEPNVYGLFIGTNYYWNELGFDPPNQELGFLEQSDLKGGETAEMVRDSFLNLPNLDIENTILISELNISSDQVKEAIDDIKVKMEPGDTFIFYISGHGGSYNSNGGETTINGESKGDEYVRLGWNPLGGLMDLTDDELFTYLNSLGTDIEKWVFIDSCHSGGFWGDYNQQDIGDLEKLNNIGFLSSSWENTDSRFFWDLDSELRGISLFGDALSQALEDYDGTEELIFDDFSSYLTDYIEDRPWLIGMIMKEMGIGDEHVFTADMWEPYIARSTDFEGVLYANTTVPEPATMLLLGTGLIGIAGLRRRFKK